MAIKKKRRTAKQIAATKKLVAFNKKRRGAVKKKAAPKKKRRAAKKSIGRRSQATGKKPSARLKRRRAKDTIKGYYPNPARKSGYVIVAVDKKSGQTGYYTGGNSLETSKSKAAIFATGTAAFDQAEKLADSFKKYLWFTLSEKESLQSLKDYMATALPRKKKR